MAPPASTGLIFPIINLLQFNLILAALVLGGARLIHKGTNDMYEDIERNVILENISQRRCFLIWMDLY
jgi:hypothetical protein